jgi:hypothetical protein
MEFNVSRPAFLKFIRKGVYDGKNGDTARMFVLKRSISGVARNTVDDWTVGSNFDADKLVDAVIEAAEEDAKGLDDTMEYELQAYFGTSKVPGRRKTFKIDPAIFDDEDELEERVKKGRDGSSKSLVQQAQRHNEAYAKMHIVGTGELVKILRAQVADLMEQNSKKDTIIEKLVSGHVNSVEKQAQITESLLSREHERKLELKEKESDHELKQATLRMLSPLANKAVEQMATRFLTAGTPAPSTQAHDKPSEEESSEPKKQISDYAMVILSFEKTFSSDADFMKVVQSGVFSQEQLGHIARLLQMAKAEAAAA